MGLSSKPLTIYIDESLYIGNELHWDSLIEQGYAIGVLRDKPDLYLAPYAMRMTSDMLVKLPSAFKLAVTGARALRYAPKGKDNVKAKGKVTRKGKHAKVQTKAPDTGESEIEGVHIKVGGPTKDHADTSTNSEGTS